MTAWQCWLKGQCVGIEVIQLCVISLPVKSSIIGVIQEFTKKEMASRLGCLAEAPVLAKTTCHRAGHPRKLKEGWESANKHINFVY